MKDIPTLTRGLTENDRSNLDELGALESKSEVQPESISTLPKQEQKQMTTVAETLKQRGSNYGSYEGNVKLRNELMSIIKQSYKEENKGKEMPEEFQGYIWDIINKLVRIATTPEHIDSWHDIQGYAKLTEDILQKRFNK